MTATLPIEAILAAVACLWGLAFLARYRPCSCEKCGFHVNEARVSREKERERVRRVRHRSFHGWSGEDWGSEACPDCREGHGDDRSQV